MNNKHPLDVQSFVKDIKLIPNNEGYTIGHPLMIGIDSNTPYQLHVSMFADFDGIEELFSQMATIMYTNKITDFIFALQFPPIEGYIDTDFIHVLRFPFPKATTKSEEKTEALILPVVEGEILDPYDNDDLIEIITNQAIRLIFAKLKAMTLADMKRWDSQ